MKILKGYIGILAVVLLVWGLMIVIVTYLYRGLAANNESKRIYTQEKNLQEKKKHCMLATSPLI